MLNSFLLPSRGHSSGTLPTREMQGSSTLYWDARPQRTSVTVPSTERRLGCYLIWFIYYVGYLHSRKALVNTAITV